MSRLIDADKLEEEMREYFKDHVTDSLCMVDGVDCSVDICGIVEEQPTAYNVDAVVSELNRASCIARPVGWRTKKEIVELKVAIEIVKDGGRDEK